ncbi:MULTISPECIES: glycoside hydrolase family 130 protein [Hydrotalea]|uniref:glycoside hydrolase family 130 protein n=1 Tax=Hydrotalea TaxID=1004300 RepID=UPI001C448F16|nr:MULTISPECIES: glycoside hydrolase family 130 protein [Hydrotalea]
MKLCKKLLPAYCFIVWIIMQPFLNRLLAQTAVYNDAWALLPFTKANAYNPILLPGKLAFTDPVTQTKVFWEAAHVFNPAMIVKNDSVFMLYRAQDSAGTSRIGMAISTDGFHFTKIPKPVLFPDNDAFKKYEWPGGCEDPRIVMDENGTYYLTYTAFDGHLARLMVATSTDLMHWKKQGPAFVNAYSGKYLNVWSKSGAIVAAYTNNNIIATKIKGQYWMYWGDQYIWCATSHDLIHWKPVEMPKGTQAAIALRGQAQNMPQLQIALPTRKGKFDSDLVESGPAAMLTPNGIRLLYNGRNIPAIGDTTLPEGTYAAGQALFNKNNPLQLQHRLQQYFMKPTEPYEINGQVNHVCFIEGLVHFKQQWFLYYGTADSKIAVATCP